MLHRVDPAVEQMMLHPRILDCVSSQALCRCLWFLGCDGLRVLCALCGHFDSWRSSRDRTSRAYRCHFYGSFQW
jgi:hypothetical protein